MFEKNLYSKNFFNFINNIVDTINLPESLNQLDIHPDHKNLS